jgi:CRP/FNR family cyclic AMP-dependent transcriptional regulator
MSFGRVSLSKIAPTDCRGPPFADKKGSSASTPRGDPLDRGEANLIMTANRKSGFNPDAFLAKAGVGRTVSKYPKHKVIFSQGDAADAVFYIQKGKVKITVVSEQGKEAVVAILVADKFCGEGCLAGQPRRISTAVAMTECEIMQLERTAFLRVLREEPAFSEMFVSHVLARSIRIEEDLVDQLFNSTEKRLARTLLLLARYGEPQVSHRALPKVSQELLAEMVGTTRSRVNFFMNKFRKLGFIDYNGALKINNSLLSVLLRD